MEAAGTLNSIQEGLARQLDEIREVCHEIEACHRSPVCPQDADPHDDLHVGRQLREATHLGAWTMSALLAYWLAEDVNHETGVVVRARDVSWSDASTRYSPDAPIDPSIRYRDPGFAAYWALFGLSLARETIDELASAIRRKAPDSILDPNESRNSAIEHALHNSRDLLFEQMARFAAQDQDADAFQLGFHLAAIVRFGSWSLSNEMLRKAFELLFVAQSALGLFDRRHPAWVSAVGEFHCTTFDLLCSLIASFEGQEWLINEYLDKFAMAIRWLEDNSLRNSNPLRSKDRWWGPNVRSGFSVAPPKLVAEIPEARATGVAYSFLHLFDKMLSKDINARVIQKLTGNPLSYGPAKDGAFEKLIGRVDVASQSADFSWLLRSTVCDPLRTKGGITDSFSLTAFAHRTEMIRSAVLFGPPGTGKTTFAEKVAQYLGWPFLSLDPSDFARGGLDLVPERAAEIFRELMELRDTVVLFDEMDELVRRRDGSATPEVDTSWVQRIWTTSLLPKLQRLHGSAHVLFFIATNSFRQMDEAIVRSGRFDFAVWIPVPEFSEKLRWCKIDTPPSRRTRVWADALEEFAQVTVVDKYLSLRYLEPEDRVVAVSPKEWFANVARAEFAAVWDQLVASDPPENQTDRFQTIRDQLKSTVPNKYPDLHAHNRFPPSMVQHLRLAQSREAGPRK